MTSAGQPRDDHPQQLSAAQEEGGGGRGTILSPDGFYLGANWYFEGGHRLGFRFVSFSMFQNGIFARFVQLKFASAEPPICCGIFKIVHSHFRLRFGPFRLKES